VRPVATSRLDAAYAAQIKQVRDRVTTFTQGRFAAGGTRDADLERFVTAVLPVVLAGRRQVSALTDAYLARVLTAKLGRPIAPRGPIDTTNLRGVPADEVYRRPYQTVWWKLSTDLPYEAAVSAGAARLADIVLSDLQLAKTTTAQRSMGTKGIQSFRRVLGGKPDCDLCVTASQNRYSREDLMPIHPGCDCGVEPDTDAPLVKSSNLITIRDHGELGPLLTYAGQHFDTGPN
jgi:hypothetical protein